MTKPFFFILALALVESCATQKGPIQHSHEEKSAAAAPRTGKTYAVLIQEEQSRQFPHLQRHLGQILIANEDNQILLPVVPPLNSPQSYFSLLTKIYRRNEQGWNAMQWLPRVEISLKGKTGQELQMIGQDITQDGQNVAVQSFFRGDGGSEAHVLFTLSNHTGHGEIRVRPSKEKVSWKLRVSRGLGEDHTIPVDKDHVAGLTTSLLPELMSIIGEQPFFFQQDSSYSYLENHGDSGGAFQFLFTRDAVLQQAEELNARIACYGKAKKAGSPPCETTASTPITLSLPAGDGQTNLWQQILVYSKQGSFRSLIPIREGESLTLPLPRKLELFVPDEEGALKPLTIPKKSARVTLPPMKRGILNLSSKSKKPSFVEIRDAVQTRGRALASWLPIREEDRLSPHTFLQSEWPLATTLPAGDYDVQVFNGTSVLCQQRVTIRPGRKSAMDCADVPNGKGFSPRASLSLDSSTLSPAFISAAQIQVATTNAPGTRKSSELLFEIPSIDVYDADVGLSLRAFPASEDIRKAWETYKKDHPAPGLNAFVDFVRSRDKNLDVVLDCPAPGFQLSEYRWITLSLKPDIIEVFGCQQPELAAELLQVAHRLQQKASKPIRLAAASYFRSSYHSQIPAIYLSNFRPDADMRKSFQRMIDDIHDGDYTLGLRTEMQIISPLKDGIVRVRIRSHEQKQSEARLRIYDQDELLADQPVALQQGAEVEADLKVALRPQSRWLRFELVGKDSNLLSEGSFLPLATSNFLSLDEVHKNQF